MKKVHSLHTTLLRIILVPAVAVLFILLGMIRVSSVLIQNEIVERQRQLIEALGRQGNQYLAETDRIMGTLANAMMDMSPESQSVLLKETRRNYPRFAALYLLDETGRVLIEDTGGASLLNLDLSNARFFRRARELGQTFFSESFISPTTGQVSVTGAVPIAEDSRLKGVLVGELNLVILQNAIEEANSGQPPHHSVHRLWVGFSLKLSLVCVDSGIQPAPDHHSYLTPGRAGRCPGAPVGFPPDLDFRHTESLGLQLVMTQAKQLGGGVQLERGQGTAFRVVFPAARFDAAVN